MTQQDAVRDLILAARADRPKFEELIRTARALVDAFPANARTVATVDKDKARRVQSRIAAATKAGLITVTGHPAPFKRTR